MKVNFAYTPKAIADAYAIGTLPGDSVWRRMGTTPFIMAANTTNVVFLSGQDMYINNGYVWMAARIYDLIQTLAEGEVLTFGYRVTIGASNRYNVAYSGLWTASGECYPILHQDVLDNAVGNIAYVECVVDPAEKTVTGYINGRKIRTLSYTQAFADSLSNTNLVFMRRQNQSAGYYFRGFYCATFKKSEGPVMLGAWTTEECPEISNELRDGDGNLTLNTVNESDKSVVFKAPAPGAHVGTDITALNPNIASKLVAQVSDGKTSTTKELTTIQSLYVLSGEFVKSNSGRPTGGITPSADASQITLKLRAQYMQE